MTNHQITLFVLLGVVFLLLIWGRWRYDLVAFAALLVAVLVKVVPVEAAFSGFAHPATVIIALVLIVSRALSNSGVIELAGHFLLSSTRKLAAHIGIMAGFAAVLSAVMNNVAALALLMPMDLEAAARAKRSPAFTLMPLSFASILGGMITLIGTPPNIVVAEFRNVSLGEPYSMFDFAPVGITCALAGVLYITFVGWRLIPRARREHDSTKELFDLGGYIAEIKVSEGSKAIGKRVRELDDIAEENESGIVGLIRRGQRLPGTARLEKIRSGDILVVEASPKNIDKLLGVLGLEYTRKGKGKKEILAEGLSLIEAVVPEGARIVARSARSLRLLYRHGVTLLGVSRQGKRFTERVRQLEVQAGDVLLLLGPNESLSDTATWMGVLPLAKRGLRVMQRQKAGIAVGIFAVAVLLASFGVIYLPIALACAAVLMYF